MGAGSSTADLCGVRGRDRSCCEINSSLFGEDAFYRDAFYDCEEGNRSHDVLFAGAREQARLKYRKTSMVVDYAKFELKQASIEPVKNALKSCTALRGEPSPLKLTNEGSPRPTTPKFMGQPTCGSAWWLGKTIEEWKSKDLPGTGEGPYWSKGAGEGLRVRVGPDYRKNGHKGDSQGSMYTALSCDAVKAGGKVTNIIHGLMHGELPVPPKYCADGECAGGNALEWTKSCPLPRIICINMMLPYTTGLNPWGAKKDGGCSFVGLFHITPETIKAVQSGSPPPHIKLFQEFWEGPAGLPGGPEDDPNRSLNARVDPKMKKDQQAGLFKAIAKCVNPEDVSVPDMFHTYNGKPCLITKCGYVVKDPAGEWLELGIDVRGFNVVARKMLCSFRHMLPRTKIHYGFLVQGIEDEDMPEGLLCDMYVHGINMMDDPADLSDEALTDPAASSSLA